MKRLSKSIKFYLLTSFISRYVFKNRWADNGDGIARQYTGTPALKSDYTRTGVRTKMGLLHDGYKSMQRSVYSRDVLEQ